jgi:hypothetical protein
MMLDRINCILQIANNLRVRPLMCMQIAKIVGCVTPQHGRILPVSATDGTVPRSGML